MSSVSLEKDLGGVRPVLKGTAEEMRAQFSGLGSALAPLYPRPSTSVKTEHGKLDTIEYRVYTPLKSENDKPFPIGVYYHPGGFVLGPSDYDDVFCRAIAERANTIIVSVQYRLSPEHKTPAHLDDAVKGFEWAYRNATRLGGDPTCMYAVGVSAGAGLALSISRRIALGHSTADPEAVKGIVALCPYAFHPENIPQTYKAAHTSSQEHIDNVPMIDGTSMRQFFEYAGLRPDDEDYFPLLDRDHHKNFPSTYVVTCQFDPLRDDGKVLAQALSAAGVPVKTNHYTGLPHCFRVFPSVTEGETFMNDTLDGLKWVLSQI
ncbi:unnamed protein product [Clonostachys solani]|uniref:Alpha/beta hydrolase fold-3 domain-containing protein n=1 Tax=Clonostachys solani TaxID=160281 RepID=A0A9P0EK41_9HYPO|nr:unnamed protein product [Clonostachys solani]